MELRSGTGVFYSPRQEYGYRRLVGDSCPPAHFHPEATVQLGNSVRWDTDADKWTPGADCSVEATKVYK